MELFLGGESVTTAIVLLFCIGIAITSFFFAKDRKYCLSREYDLLCDSTTVIRALGNCKNESDNFYTKVVSNNNGTYLLCCSGSYLLDYTFEIRFIDSDKKTTMAIFPTDKLANHGGAEYHYISKLDKFMKEYAKF